MVPWYEDTDDRLGAQPAVQVAEIDRPGKAA